MHIHLEMGSYKFKRIGTIIYLGHKLSQKDEIQTEIRERIKRDIDSSMD